jgi:outer membrane protein
MKEMKKKLIGGMIALLCMSGVGYAEGLKVAFVDAQKVLNNTKEGGRLRQVLDEFVQARQKVIDLEEKELTRLRDEFEKLQSLLSEDALRVKQAEIEKAIEQYREKVSSLQIEVREKRTSALGEFNQKLEQSVKQISEKEGYSLVLDKNPERGAVIYGNATYDITKGVITHMDSIYAEAKGKTESEKEKEKK